MASQSDIGEKQYLLQQLAGYRAAVTGLARSANWFSPVRPGGADEQGWFDGWDLAKRDGAEAAARAASEVVTLRSVCGEAYQLAGAYDAPVAALDNLFAAATGGPLPHRTFLPVVLIPAGGSHV